MMVISIRAEEFDLTSAFDPTGKTSISGAQLFQLVNTAYPKSERGLIIASANTPDIVTTPRYTNYLWVDLTVPTAPSLKFYVAGTGWTNTLSGTTLTSNNIADGSIVNSKLGNGAVSQDKILPYSVGNLQLADLAVNAAKIADGTITAGKIAADAINTYAITNGAVTGVKIATATITSDKITNVNAQTITNITDILPQVYTNSALTNFNSGASGSNQVLFSGTVAPYPPVYRDLFLTSTSDVAGVAVSTRMLLISGTHSLGYVPKSLRVAFSFTNAMYGYDTGEEIDFYSLSCSNSVGEFIIGSVGATPTNVYILAGTNVYVHGSHFITDRVSGNRTNLANNFSTNLYGVWKFYYR